ncbi:hypothetical protein AMTRI_Chr08g163800 [Amborella trichopoda]
MVGPRRPQIVLFGSSIVQFSFPNGGRGVPWPTSTPERYFLFESGLAFFIAFLIYVVVVSVSGTVCSRSDILPGDNNRCENLDLSIASFLHKNMLGSSSSTVYVITLLTSGQSSMITGVLGTSNKEIAEKSNDKADILVRGYSGWNTRRALEVIEKLFPKEEWIERHGVHFSSEGSDTLVAEILKILKEAEWEPSLHWKALPTEFAADSPYDLAASDGKSTLEHIRVGVPQGGQVGLDH